MSIYEGRDFGEAIKILEKQGYSLDLINVSTQQFLNGINFGTLIVGVGAAKGGVGKSTVAINLAHSFARTGLKTGVVDVDFNDPNDAYYVNKDAKGLRLNEKDNVIFDNGISLIDVVLGEKKFLQRKRKKGSKAEYTFEKKGLDEVGIPSLSKPNLTYFLTGQLGDNLEGRGNKTEREEALLHAHDTVLKQTRNLADFDVVVLDFPFGTPEYLDAYVGCDRRIYVVDYNNDASFKGILNVAKLVEKRRIEGKDNFLVINRIPEEYKDKTISDFLNAVHPKLTKLFHKVTDGYGAYRQDAEKKFRDTNKDLRDLSLEKLAFAEHPTYLFEERGVLRSSNIGIPYLSDGSTRNVYSGDLLKLATYLVDSRIKEIKEGGTIHG